MKITNYPTATKRYAILAICILLATLAAACSSERALGTHDGRFHEGFFPRDIGGLRKDGIDVYEVPRNMEKFRPISYRATRYQKFGHRGDDLKIAATNFTSPEAAANALSSMHKQISEAPHASLSQLEPKLKAGANVGQRFVATWDGGTEQIIMWTNGSVLFQLSSARNDKDTMLERKLAFEKSFLY